MLLKFTLQKGRGIVIKMAAPGNERSGLEPIVIAEVAPLCFAENHVLQECFHVVAVLVNHFQVHLFGIYSQRLFTTETFLIRMDVAIIKKAYDFMTF